jgi:hypothetical protein
MQSITAHAPSYQKATKGLGALQGKTFHFVSFF